MPKVEFTVTQPVLDWVVAQTQDEPVNDATLLRLHAWKEGKAVPTLRQIEEVSKKTKIPFGYFFLQKPPREDFPLIEYRTIDSGNVPAPSRNLHDIVFNMEQAQDWMSRYAQDNGYDPVACVGRCSPASGVSAVVTDIREMLGLQEGWFRAKKAQRPDDAFKYLRRKLEACRIMVMMSGIVGCNTHRILRLDEFRAFTLIDDYAPLIFINAADAWGGRVFSLLHETAHVWIGQNSLYNLPTESTQKVSRTEVLCNAVAAEILVPAKLFAEAWEKEFAENLEARIGAVVQGFPCSREVIARRAADLRLITKADYARLIAAWRNCAAEKKNSSGGNFLTTVKSRLDPNFVLALDRDTRTGRTMFTEACELTGLNRKSFDTLVRQLTEA